MFPHFTRLFSHTLVACPRRCLAQPVYVLVASSHSVLCELAFRTSFFHHLFCVRLIFLSVPAQRFAHSRFNKQCHSRLFSHSSLPNATTQPFTTFICTRYAPAGDGFTPRPFAHALSCYAPRSNSPTTMSTNSATRSLCSTTRSRSAPYAPSTRCVVAQDVSIFSRFGLLFLGDTCIECFRFVRRSRFSCHSG